MKRIPIFSPDWWARTDSPRWGIAVGAILMAVLTLFGTHLLNKVQSSVERQAAQVQVLRDAMVEFQVFVSAYSTEMFSEGQVSTTTRARLIENLNKQHALIRGMPRAVADNAGVEMERYRATLLAMIDAANRTTDIVSMSDFWSAASDLMVAKNRLDERLKPMAIS